MRWATVVLLVSLSLAICGCGASNSVERPENPDPLPTEPPASVNSGQQTDQIPLD